MRSRKDRFIFFSSHSTGICLMILLFSSCTIVRKYQKNKPFVFENNINLIIDGVNSDEKTIIRSRLNTQLDDSSRVRIKDVAFALHYIDRPPVFDTSIARRSADNMQASMVHLGYYRAKVDFDFKIDSNKNKSQYRTITNYNVVAGKRTLIDTFAYQLSKPDLQSLALSTKDFATLKEGMPVTKGAVLGETNRLVDLYRNNGYYRFTAEELRVTGDTTIEALTAVSDDPFETLRLLAEANELRNKPSIRLAMILNSASDTNKFSKFHIGNIYILPDYKPGDSYLDSNLSEVRSKNYIIRFHKYLFKTKLLTSAMSIRKGDLYKQDDFYKTINNLYRLGVWQSPTLDIIERRDSSLLDLVIKLSPVKKFGFEGNIELSYSANSNSSNSISGTNSGNLLGIAGNVSILNRNLAKEAIRMTNSFRAGIEFNTKRSSTGTLVNSQELSYSNNLVFPKFIGLLKPWSKNPFLTKQSFINTNLSFIRRIDFFNQQVVNIGFGHNWSTKPNQNWSWRLFNFDFRRLYNQSARFDTTLMENPFLRYSFTTALVMGSSVSYSRQKINAKHPKRANTLKINLEESGLLYGRFANLLSSAGNNNFFEKYLKEFIKTDVEYTYTISHPKSAVVFRTFVGVGVPLTRSDTTLPFFKQYYGGGPNSMRGWPVRGLGVGGQPLAPFVNNNRFNDRTGDIQLEGNAEYRFNIAPLFSNAITLKGAFFVDAGNIWNFKYTKTDGSRDSTQFKFKDLYKQLAVAAGTGFRLDFSYFLIRLDLGFRFKRPDVSKNNGWQIPNANLSHLFRGGDENRKWRYENFNFTIGIDYPF